MNTNPQARLLLISNSVNYGSGFLDHCAKEIVAFLGGTVKTITFVPYAKIEQSAYTEIARKRFLSLGYDLISVHESDNPRRIVEHSAAIFIGGGNTFLLLNELYENDLLGTIRKNVAERAIPYLGASAGVNVACPSIKTTNDMPIISPPSLDALDLVPFNINPHYFDPDPNSTHMGESRKERIRQFHELNERPVIGMREGAMLLVEGCDIVLKGNTGAVVFKKGEESQEVKAGQQLGQLLLQ